MKRSQRTLSAPMPNDTDSDSDDDTDRPIFHPKPLPQNLRPPDSHPTVVDLAGFSQGTTFHGVDQLFSAGNWCAKVFWLLVILFVMVMAIVQIRNLVLYFMQNPTLTSITLVYANDGLQLPPITVCTLLKTNQSRLREKFPTMNSTLLAFSTASFMSAYSTALEDWGYFIRKNISKSGMQRMQEALDEELGKMTFVDFFEDTTFDCRGQFLYCWFENGGLFDCCDERSPVSANRFLIHSGACFEFKLTGIKQRLPGPVGGFGFAFWYPNEDQMPTVFNSYDEHAVHLYTSPSDAMLEKQPIVLQVGTHAHISLQASKTSQKMVDQLGRTTCVEKSLRYFNEYSYANCQMECLIDSLLNGCNCTGLNTFAHVNRSLICTPVQAFHCIFALGADFSSILVQCRSDRCSESCSYWNYKSSMTFGKVFNPNLKEMEKYWRLPTTNVSKSGNSLIIADVYFSEIEYTDVKQLSAFTIESFVSNIGGSLGLWTGASIITWIHLVYFWIGSCLHARRKRTKKGKDQKMLDRFVISKIAESGIVLDARVHKTSPEKTNMEKKDDAV